MNRNTVFFILLFISTAIMAQQTTGPSERSQLRGSISIISNPPDAFILMDNKEIAYRTPALVTDLTAGLHTIEVSLPDYLFAKRQITVLPDTTLTVSFELISLLDTTHIIGDLRLGILSLPRPPVKSPYLVDNKQVYSQEITLNAGKHHVLWEGGNVYSSLDTIIEIFSGKLTSFSFAPERLSGRLIVSPQPLDADIYINNTYNSTGELEITVSTGTYTIQVQRNGYKPHSAHVTVNPGKQHVLEIFLERIPDRDNDGFLDSCDRCPAVYGLYDGCPVQDRKDILRRYKNLVAENIRKQPLTVSFNPIGFLWRDPTNFGFKELLSYFNDGRFFCNNRLGIVFANTYAVSWHGLILSCELGQWISPLTYKKKWHNPIELKTKETSYYIFYKDSSTHINPQISLPGTAVSGGFNLTIKRFQCSYSMGYQWENIIISELISKDNFEKYMILTDSLQQANIPYTGPKTKIIYNNSHWFHKVRLEYDLAEGKKTLPSLYSTVTISFDQRQQTGWHTFQAGLLYKIYPSTIKNYHKAMYARRDEKK